MRSVFLVVCLFLIPVSGRSQGTTSYTVFPIGMETVNGNNSDSIFFFLPDQRQQVTLGSYLQQVWATPVLINEIAFRVDEGRGNLDAVIPEVEVRLSTTDRVPSNLSPEWRFNVGADGRTVFQRNNMPISASGGVGPNPPDLRFVLDVPFYYDPSRGNLLMLVRTAGTGILQGGQANDMHSFPNLAGSPVAIIGGAFQNPHASAWVTEIGWVSVPEPTVRMLIAGSFLYIGVRQSRSLIL